MTNFNQNLCNTFRAQAFYTWDLLSKSKLNNYQVGEETITDLNLLEIKSRHKKAIYIKEFNKKEEGKFGADWEWWFQGISGLWLGFRVQAKVIKLTSGKFEHLHYWKKKQKLYQSELLIDKALNSSIKTIPLYCFYIYTDNNYHRIIQSWIQAGGNNGTCILPSNYFNCWGWLSSNL